MASCNKVVLYGAISRIILRAFPSIRTYRNNYIGASIQPYAGSEIIKARPAAATGIFTVGTNT